MSELRKIFKQRELSELLTGAVRIAGPGVFAKVTDADGDSLALGGQAPASSQNGFLKRPLKGKDGIVGYLVLGLSAGENVSGETNQRLGDLAELLHGVFTKALKNNRVKRALANETLEQYRELAVTQRSIFRFTASMQVNEVARALLEEAHSANRHVHAGCVCLMSKSDAPSACVDSFGFSGEEADLMVNSRVSKDIVKRGVGEVLNDLGTDPRWRDDIKGLRGLMCIPLVSSGKVHGALFLAVREGGEPFASAHLKKTNTLATVAGIAISNAIHFEQIQNILTALMQTMSTAIDARDHLTAGHSHRVAHLALGLMRVASEDQTLLPEMEFSADQLREIYYAGLLHDVGKIGVREEVLTKATRLPLAHMELLRLRLALWGQLNDKPWLPMSDRLSAINESYDLDDEDEALINALCGMKVVMGGQEVVILDESEKDRLLTPRGNLTPDEWEEIKRHPEESYRILKTIPFTSFFPQLLTMVRQHHERLDGSGYPDQARARDIVPQSRILAIVDIYDSLRRDRHYKKALSQKKALHILREEAAQGKLDKRLVEVFCANVQDIEPLASDECGSYFDTVFVH